MPDSETLIVELPEPGVLKLLGAVNMAWSSLDATVSGALATAIGGDPVSSFISFGQLETVPKMARLQMILTHKGDQASAQKLAAIKRVLNEHRDLRNAITHGFYLGRTSKQEICYSLIHQMLTNEPGRTATVFFAADANDLSAHIDAVMGVNRDLLALLDVGALRSILLLPSRVRPTGG